MSEVIEWMGSDRCPKIKELIEGDFGERWFMTETVLAVCDRGRAHLAWCEINADDKDDWGWAADEPGFEGESVKEWFYIPRPKSVTE